MIQRNVIQKCDPKMSSTHKSNQGYFGLKFYIGVDSQRKYPCNNDQMCLNQFSGG